MGVEDRSVWRGYGAQNSELNFGHCVCAFPQPSILKVQGGKWFCECLLCAGDPVGSEVAVLPASQHNRRLCTQKGAETIALAHQVRSSIPSSVVGSFFWFPRLLRARLGPHVPCSLAFSQSHLQRRYESRSPEVMKSSLPCPETGLPWTLSLIDIQPLSICLQRWGANLARKTTHINIF